MDYNQRSEYTLLPGKLNRQLQRLTIVDFLVITLLALVAVTLNRLFGFVGLTIGLLLLAFLIDQKNDARMYDLIFIEQPADLGLKLKKGWIWKEGDKRGVIPNKVKRLGAKDTNIALNYGGEGTEKVSVVLPANGSDFMSRSVTGMLEWIDHFSSVLEDIGAKHGFKVEVGFLLRTRPWDPHEDDVYAHNAFDVDVLLPKKLLGDDVELTPDEVLAWEAFEYTNELHQTFVEEGLTTPTMALVVTIRRTVSVGSRAIFEDEEARQPILEIAQNAASLMESQGIEGVRILDTRGMQTFFREGWDVVGLEQYRKDLHQGTLSDTQHWPEEGIRVLSKPVRKCLKIDGNYHCLLRLTKTNRIGSPVYMTQIYSVPVRNKTISLITQSMQASTEKYATGFVIELAEGIREVLGSRTRATGKRKQQDRLEREEEADRNPRKQVYDIFIDIAATNKAELVRQTKEALEYYAKIPGVEVQLFKGPGRMLHRRFWQAATAMK